MNYEESTKDKSRSQCWLQISAIYSSPRTVRLIFSEQGWKGYIAVKNKLYVDI